MKTPPHFVIYRLAAVTITALVLLAVGLGAAGHGPLGGLGARTCQAEQLIHNWYANGWFG
jgi:hypothetical protein